MVPAADSFSASHIFVGPLVDGRPAGFADAVSEREHFTPSRMAFPGPKSVQIYVSLGTVYSEDADFFRSAFEAFGGCGASPWRVVVSTGKPGFARKLGRVPENVRVYDGVDQERVLRASDVFVTHGGMNGVLQALRLGIPMVVLPRTDEQRMTAARLQELGVAEWIRTAHLAPLELRDAVRRVVQEPSVRAGLARLQPHFAQSVIDTALSCILGLLNRQSSRLSHKLRPAFVH